MAYATNPENPFELADLQTNNISESTFDYDGISSIEQTFNETSLIMSKYDTFSETRIIKYIVTPSEKKPSIESTKLLNYIDEDSKIKLKESGQAANDDADRDDDELRRQEQIELLRSIKVVDYARIRTSKFKNEQNRYRQLKTRIVMLKEKDQTRQKKIKEEMWQVRLSSATTAAVVIGTFVAVSLNLTIVAMLSNPETWIKLVSTIYGNPVAFGYFNSLMSMLDIFNQTERLQIKSLFNTLQSAIKTSKKTNPQNPPFDDPEFIEYMTKLLWGGYEEDAILKDKFKDFISEDDGKPNHKMLEFTNFVQEILGIIKKKNIIPIKLTP